MRLRLTDIAVRKLALTIHGQITHWDATTPGFGVRCSTRTKSYVVMYGAKRRLKTLGRHPDLSLAEARRRAKLQLAQQMPLGDQIGGFDYPTVLSEYISDCERRLRPSTLDGYTLYLNGIRFTGAVDRITRQDILRKIRAFTDSPSSQNYAFTTFKVMFNWLVRNQYLHSNPLDGLNRPHSPKARDRVLSSEEVTQLLRYTLCGPDRFKNIVSLLLMTGQRRGEIAGLKWSEIDSGQLSFSASRTKNKYGHEVPIPHLASELLEAIEGGQTFAFGTPDADVPFSGWSRAHRRLMRETELAPFTLHDLRRTFATLHAEIGTPIHVTERLLNHRSGTISGVAAVYNRHSYFSEMRAATDAYDDLLATLIKS